MPTVLAFFVTGTSIDQFRQDEVVAVAKMFGAVEPSDLVFHTALLPGDTAVYLDVRDLTLARGLLSRSMFLRAILVPFGEATTFSGLVQAVSLNAERLANDGLFGAPGDTFKYTVETVGKKIQQGDKVDVLNMFQGLPHEGTVDLKAPGTEYWVIGLFDGSTKELVRCFHGKLVGVSRRAHLMDAYNLKKRPYIGTTSMPPELTFLMANMGLVVPGTLVMDCFCGTASTIVSCSEHGAMCIGSDFDGRTLRGGQTSRAGGATGEETTPLSVRGNYTFYGLDARQPELLRINFSENRLWRVPADGFLDCILSDPPYGVRERKRRPDAQKLDDIKAHRDALAADEAPPPPPIATIPTEDYSAGDIVVDLVMFAARALVMGGRLVYWHVTTPSYTDAELPRHPSLRLIANQNQVVTLKMHRRLVTFEKVAPVPLGLTKDAVRGTDPEDIRRLMDATDVPHCPEYMEFRGKKEEKRAKALAYRKEHGVTAERLKATRAERRAECDANRVKRVQERHEKHELSKLKNQRISQESKGAGATRDRTPDADE